MFTYRIDSDTELRLLEERHAETAFALIDQNREHLRTWLPWAKPGYSLEDCRGYIKQTLQRLADNKGFDVAIFYRGQMAGQIGYNSIDWPNRATEIGYWLGATFQGKGLITVACRALLDHAFYELKLNRVEIRCAVENTRSRAVPERLGFRQDGVLRQVEWLHDRFVDLVVYSMLASEWVHLRQS
ncbi:MAG: GNAT family N-acetyltransferase [Anaerolineae bacterium]|nr:GNAT family N-acetyltransferase [Anaerolineae bacterium]